MAAAPGAAAAALHDNDYHMMDADGEERKYSDPLYSADNFCDDAEFSDGEDEERVNEAAAHAAVPSRARPPQPQPRDWNFFGVNASSSVSPSGDGGGGGAAAASESHSRFGDVLNADEWARAAADNP